MRSTGLVAALMLALLLPSISAAAEHTRRNTAGAPHVASLAEDWSQGSDLATELTKLTGVMLAPMLGLSVMGAYHWYQASPAQRARLPWHDRPAVFGPMFAIMLLLFLGHRIPIVKHAFKQVKVLENKASGLLALPIVASGVAAALAHPVGGAVVRLSREILPVAYASTGVTSTGATHGLELAVGYVGALLMGAAVWLVGHSVNVLVAMSPFSLIDALLKGAKGAALFVLLVAAKLSPGLGAAVAATYILFALLVAGWAFRLTVFGWVFSTDIIVRRGRSARVDGPVAAFSAAGCERLPVRTFGHLVEREGQRRFVYRSFAIGPRREVALPQGPLVVVRGVVSPVLLAKAPEERTLFRLPPRFRSRAAELASAWSLPLEEAPLRRGFGAAIRWVRAQLGGARAEPSAGG